MTSAQATDIARWNAIGGVPISEWVARRAKAVRPKPKPDLSLIMRIARLKSAMQRYDLTEREVIEARDMRRRGKARTVAEAARIVRDDRKLR